MRVESDGINTMRFDVNGFTFTFKRDDGPLTAADLDHVIGVVKAMRELRDTIREETMGGHQVR
jgi:hypothetical protein